MLVILPMSSASSDSMPASERHSKLLCLIALAAGLIAGARPVLAETYPAKPVKIIVSTSPGGITDIAARILGAHITDRSGQPVVIDNRAGASGNIAMDAVARAAPDGYTLGLASTGNITINPLLFAHLPFDPLTDLKPVGPIGMVPLFLVVNGSVPANTLSEFVAYAKAHPKKVNYAAAGAGTTPDLAAREFARRAGLNLVMVPFKGTHPATTAVITGEVQATFVSIGPYIEFVRNGALRILAAATREREPYVPDSPTFAEEGFPGFEVSTWFALFAPRGTPDAVVEALNGYTRSVRNDPDAKRRLESNYIDPLNLTAAGFAALVKADAIKWERIVRLTAARLN
jgi:tripartite-type tricarboxylate transporter receptor subunit TctC